MLKRKPQLPQEGDLLFEKKPEFLSENFLGSAFFALIFDFVTIKYFNTLTYLGWAIFGFGTLLFSFNFVVILVDGFRNGFKNETYKGFYFHDKIVFYRISKWLYEFTTMGKTKERLQQEIAETEQKIDENTNELSSFDFSLLQFKDWQEVQEFEKEQDEKMAALIMVNHFFALKIDRKLSRLKIISDLKEPLVTDDAIKNKLPNLSIKEFFDIRNYLLNRSTALRLQVYHTFLTQGLDSAENLGKPRKSEILLKNIKYFMNEKDFIRLVTIESDDTGTPNFFYNKLKLSKKYEKHKSEVVGFFNLRVAEAKKNVSMEKESIV